MKADFNLMDVTCRDGSYAVNFQLSLSNQKNICLALEDLGYQFVEIGHGMGVGAGRNLKYKALHTDDEYMQNAQMYLKNIKYGVFCIPGVADLDDVRKAAEYGCSFIRIGCNVEDIDKTEEYIVLAKSLGMMVTSNYMKSYASKTEEFQQAVLKSESWGSDLVYIVDSAGSMMPDDVERYFESIKRVSNIKTGFHGHDNIGMALANSIHAIKLGMDFIDCSLQGLGRSAGNTATETLTMCLMKMGYELNIDEIEMLLSSKKYVYPLLKKKGINPIDAECGNAGFHSSYLYDIHRVSAEYEVNPLLLIQEYCKFDQVGMDKEKLEDIAAELPKDIESGYLVDFQNYLGEEQ